MAERISAAPKNGAGAAALLAAGIGAMALAIVAIAADKVASVKSALNIYTPTGPLSGVTTAAILLWLAIWMVLHRRWRRIDLALGPVTTAALTLLVAALLLTFPPLADLF